MTQVFESKTAFSDCHSVFSRQNATDKLAVWIDECYHCCSVLKDPVGVDGNRELAAYFNQKLFQIGAQRYYEVRRKGVFAY